MSPHAIIDRHYPDSGPEPPQLVDVNHAGTCTPTSDGTASTQDSSVVSEPIAIVGMGEIRV